MNRNLENLLNGNKNPKFKSEGERRIAYFLNENAIRYQYETGVLVHADDHKPRIWYPDFYLPEFGTYIEYYGLKGKRNYDSGIKRKETTYKRMGLEVIPVYPYTGYLYGIEGAYRYKAAQ
ncbi:conserved domain protein [delta proteobacterium NaphS2]|nr:conserved domain protein [delta proteobacterium NaphS2]